MEIVGPAIPEVAQVLTPESQALLRGLEREFRPARQRLLERRMERRRELASGGRLATPAAAPGDSRDDGSSPEWSVPPAPPGLIDRRVEITGPAEPK
jgi:malate synthase